jgi:PilZ domain
MLFFKRILNLAESDDGASERRRAPRYAVGADFPAQTILNITGRDEYGQPLKSSHGQGWNWGGRLLDISGSGARMQLPPSVLAARGDTCHLKLNLGRYQLVVPGKITHMRELKDSVALGLILNAHEPEIRQAYAQLVELVALGASLKPAKSVSPDRTGYAIERYDSDKDSHLTIWRHTINRQIVAFAFQLKEWLVRGTAVNRDLEYLLAAPDAKAKPVASAQSAEIERLFRWVVPNLANAVPADARTFLHRYSS